MVNGKLEWSRKTKKSDLRKIIREEIQKTLSEIKLPANRFNDDYKLLIKKAQKLPRWEEKPYVNRTTATHTVEGKIDGKERWFGWNYPGDYGPVFNFTGLHEMGGDMYGEFLRQEKQLMT